MYVKGTTFSDWWNEDENCPNEATTITRMELAKITWDAAMEAAAKNLEAFLSLQADLEPSLSELGKMVTQAQMATQRDCVNAIRGLKT